MTSRQKTVWYSTSRRAQERWKASSTTLPAEARVPGLTWIEERGRPECVGPFPICLPLEHADLNLVQPVRSAAIARFATHRIVWHGASAAPDGTPWPSSHLLDSQVQCVNVLSSVATAGDRGLAFAQAVEPAAVAMVDVEDGSPVAFEWIGRADHLGERRGGPGERGRFTTSADALMVALRADGGRTGILVEWKYTESYDAPVPFIGRGGTDRREVYRHRYEWPDGPFRVKPSIEAFFHEPHYQLLRLVLLADAMVAAGELGIDRAVVVHAVPAGNDALLATVPEGLRTWGRAVPEVWSALVGGGRVAWRWLDTTPWLSATAALAERYGGGRSVGPPG